MTNEFINSTETENQYPNLSEAQTPDELQRIYDHRMKAIRAEGHQRFLDYQRRRSDTCRTFSKIEREIRQSIFDLEMRLHNEREKKCNIIADANDWYQRTIDANTAKRAELRDQYYLHMTELKQR